jgi:hypothetical protein
VRACGRGDTNHWKMPCSSIQRPLWSIPHSNQILVVRILLANDVRRHQRIHLKVLEMSVARRHHVSQCNAPQLQPSNRNIWCVGHWLHGAIPKSQDCEYILVPVDYVSK